MLSSDRELQRLLENVVGDLSLAMNHIQLQQLATHFSLLLKWNEKINLTSIRKPEEIATRHFEESLFLTKLLPAPQSLMVDVGSGAGFPGLPLKIVWPDVATVLLEPNHKKATFLKEVVRGCGLAGVDVQTERLESVARGDLAGRAALVTMRAVKPSRELLADLKRLVAPAGQVALFVSEQSASELRESLEFQWVTPAPIPHSERRVVLLGTSSSDS